MVYICWGCVSAYVSPIGSDQVRKSGEYDTPIDRNPLKLSSLKYRTYIVYRWRALSQNTVLWESKAPVVTTGPSLSFDQRIPSADLKVSRPLLAIVPPTALKRSSGLQSGLESLKGAKLWVS